MSRQQYDDREGWEIVWSGAEPLLPPRDENPSMVWTIPPPRRKFSWSGKYVKKAVGIPPSVPKVEKPDAE